MVILLNNDFHDKNVAVFTPQMKTKQKLCLVPTINRNIMGFKQICIKTFMQLVAFVKSDSVHETSNHRQYIQPFHKYLIC